ncbi:hypothetical protein BOX15_Mlig000673g1 [Macrostomum lignano]|uniref:Uncharacterized protein n=1 Tax=Macrostomum lignano TaxID=282301 RepID=A0A267EJL1_9PLAT|nr:hypothetical protein BOX15_Mlig000673g1 [Macrostomum lignano]
MKTFTLVFGISALLLAASQQVDCVFCPPGWLLTTSRGLCIGTPSFQAAAGIRAATAADFCGRAVRQAGLASSAADPDVLRLGQKLAKGRRLWVSGCSKASIERNDESRQCCAINPVDGKITPTACSELLPPLCSAPPLLSRQKRQYSYYYYYLYSATTRSPYYDSYYYSSGAYVGLVIGVILAILVPIVIVVLVIWCCCKCCKSKTVVVNPVRQPQPMGMGVNIVNVQNMQHH